MFFERATNPSIFRILNMFNRLPFCGTFSSIYPNLKYFGILICESYCTCFFFQPRIDYFDDIVTYWRLKKKTRFKFHALSRMLVPRYEKLLERYLKNKIGETLKYFRETAGDLVLNSLHVSLGSNVCVQAFVRVLAYYVFPTLKRIKKEWILGCTLSILTYSVHSSFPILHYLMAYILS